MPGTYVASTNETPSLSNLKGGVLDFPVLQSITDNLLESEATKRCWPSSWKEAEVTRPLPGITEPI